MKQFANAPVKNRMLEVRAKLSQRHERKSPKVKSRMRQGEKFGVDDLIAIKKQIEIDCARALL